MELERGDRVRLLRDLEGLPAGMQGVVFGFYRRPANETYAVVFGPEAREVTEQDVEKAA